MAERQFGPYRLVRQVAVGGMAEIHLAKTKGLAGFEKYVAVKMIHPNFAEDEQFIQMLVDEAKIAVQLTHGNIAQTFDLGRVGSTYYITMEYIDGADLYKLLRKGSEVDFEMPLDVCAFVGKEVAAALDYAHRKKDVLGKPLGIVHRDVSPQNVLVSYAGEIKLVDFGIAKATSKAKQTAIGVIKGKYYYMSPEQAWGDPIDYRSDIFSAGIVLYEMITGQMLYLEEDLHRLLDMARKADIKPPSTLRAGIPPQLEKIVMHALAKVPGERYQSASDMATDLERFLHAYAPVFNAGKVAGILRQIVGESPPLPADEGYEVEVREGANSTHPLPLEALAHSSEEIRDENSVIFRVDELKGGNAPARPKTPPAGSPRPQQAVVQGGFGKPTAPPIKKVLSGNPGPNAAPRVTRATADSPPAGMPAQRAQVKTPPGVPSMQGKPQPPTGKIPSMPGARSPAAAPPHGGAVGSMPRPPQVAAPARPAPRSREVDEETREMVPAPASADGGADMSGLLTFDAPPAAPLGKAKGRPPAATPPPQQKRAPQWADGADTHSIEEDLANIGDRTQITAAPRASNYGTSEQISEDDDVRYDGGGDATMMTMNPTRPPDALELEDETNPGLRGADDDGADEDDLAAAIDQALQADKRGGGDRSDTATQAAQIGTLPSGGDDDDDAPTMAPGDFGGSGPDEDGPTMQRDFRDQPPPPKRAPRTQRQAAQAPAALAAKIHSPAVSELRKPRPSRRTPPDGVPAQGKSNVLQAIVGAQASEPMPTPRPMAAVQPPPSYQPPPPPYNPNGNGTQPLRGMPAQQMPPPPQPQLLQTPPPQQPYQQQQPPPPQPYPNNGYGYEQQMQQMQMQQPPMPPPPQTPPFGFDPFQQQQQQQQYPSPGQMYGYQPPQQPFGQPPTLSGAFRIADAAADEIPAHLQLNRSRRGLVIVLVGLAVLGIAAVVAIFVSRANHDVTPTVGSIRVESSPPGAEITLDGQRLTDPTPFTIEGVPVGTRHDVKVSLAHYIGDSETVDVPKAGGEAQVTAILKPVTGVLKVVSMPAGAEIKIDNVNRGVTPKTITDVDMRSAKHLELRLKDYQVFTQDLTWPDNAEIDLDAKLVK